MLLFILLSSSTKTDSGVKLIVCMCSDCWGVYLELRRLLQVLQYLCCTIVHTAIAGRQSDVVTIKQDLLR